MKIAINQPRSSYYVGGAEMVSMEHAKAFLALGNDVTFFTISPDSINNEYSKQYINFKKQYYKIHFREIKQDKKALYVYDTQPGENRDRWNIEAFYYNRMLFREIEKEPKIYNFMLSYFNLDALVVPTKKITNNVLYLCGVPQDESDFRTAYLAMYDKIFAITDETKRYWQKYTEKHIPVVPTGVDFRKFKPSIPDAGKINILFVGRLIKRKGCDIFINALSQIPEKTLDKAKVLVIGDGPQKNNLLRLTSDLNMNKYVEFKGVVDNPELYLSTATICVFPSLRGEGLQGVILEAMASGAAVIASDNEINRDLLCEGRGVIVDVSDKNIISTEIVKLINDHVLANLIGLRAREYIKINYGWEKIAKEVVNIL